MRGFIRDIRRLGLTSRFAEALGFFVSGIFCMVLGVWLGELAGFMFGLMGAALGAYYFAGCLREMSRRRGREALP